MPAAASVRSQPYESLLHKTGNWIPDIPRPFRYLSALLKNIMIHEITKRYMVYGSRLKGCRFFRSKDITYP